MNAGQNVAFAPDGAHVLEASAVGTDALIEDLGAHLLLGEVVDGVLDLAGVFGIDFCKVRKDVLFDFVLTRFALLSVKGIQRPVELVRRICAHCGIQFFGNVIQLDRLLLFADCGDDDVLDIGADLADLLVAEHDGADHLVVRDLVRARLDHEDGVLGACKVEMDGALCALRGIGIDDVLAVHKSHDDGTGGSHPGDIGNGERDGGADHGKGLGCDVRLHGERGRHDDDVVEQSLGEQGTKRAVDEARREDRLVARSALPSFEAAGNLADGVHLLFIVHLKGEEVDAVARRLGHAHRHHDGGLAAAHHARAVRLFGVLARFDGHRAGANVQLKLLVIHFLSP